MLFNSILPNSVFPRRFLRITSETLLTLRVFVSGYGLLCVLYRDMTLYGDKIVIRLLLTPISNVALPRW